MIDQTSLTCYLREKFGGSKIEWVGLSDLSGDLERDDALKQFGYGKPLLLHFLVDDVPHKRVLHSVRRNGFGRERDEDGVAAMWLDWQTFGRLPHHVPALDFVAVRADGRLMSLNSAESVHILTDYVPGKLYADDLIRLRDGGSLEADDCHRAIHLATYLAIIHQKRHDDPLLWRRRVRDLVGHGEGVMGQTDNFVLEGTQIKHCDLFTMEQQINLWRWRIKPLVHRLCQAHGDFHPFNILFDGGDLHLLDRSRGEWGAAEDDVACLSINYLFMSLQRYGKLTGEFETLHKLFWKTYLRERYDSELLSVIQPWLAWRVLVLANPLWYPTLTDDLRGKLWNFGHNVLEGQCYEWHNVNQYL